MTFRSVLALLLLAFFATGPAARANGAPSQGKFAWFNLATSDAAGAKKFYGAVFGWQFSADPDGRKFILIQHDGRDLGALVLPPDAAKAKGTRWISLIAVTDAAATARKVEAAGGKVLMAPTVVAGYGTHALFRDADGALFGVLQPLGAEVAGEVEANEFFWADLLSPDPAKSAEFYRAIAGYDVSSAHLAPGIDRVVLSSGEIKRAGIHQLPAEMKQAGWLPYVVVDDVPATLALVTQAGGRVLVAPNPAVLDGQLAVFADPAGGVLGIVKWTAPAKN